MTETKTRRAGDPLVLDELLRWETFAGGLCDLAGVDARTRASVVNIALHVPESRQTLFAGALASFERLSVPQRERLVTLLHGLES